MAEVNPHELIWGFAFIGGWLLLAATHLMSLKWGAIFGITAGRHAIKRERNPAKFWTTWLLLALPFVVLPAFAIVGFFMSGEGQ